MDRLRCRGLEAAVLVQKMIGCDQQVRHDRFRCRQRRMDRRSEAARGGPTATSTTRSRPARSRASASVRLLAALSPTSSPRPTAGSPSTSASFRPPGTLAEERCRSGGQHRLQHRARSDGAVDDRRAVRRCRSLQSAGTSAPFPVSRSCVSPSPSTRASRARSTRETGGETDEETVSHRNRRPGGPARFRPVSPTRTSVRTAATPRTRTPAPVVTVHTPRSRP